MLNKYAESAERLNRDKKQDLPNSGPLRWGSAFSARSLIPSNL